MDMISTAEVLRLRAIKPSVCDRSAKRFAQDDGFVGGLKGLETASWICRKPEKIEKVTALGMTKGRVGFPMGRSVTGIPGLKSETWGTLRMFPMQ
jgi:hypothetical protein